MSQQTQHFQKAPIVEALVGIDLAQMLSEDTLPILMQLGEQLHPTYPTTENIVMGQFKFEIGQGAQPTQQNTHLGYFFRSSDRLQVVQARRNGFGFSRLAPYQDWEHFISEAKRIWALYRNVAGSSPLQRWSIRYINKFSWPAQDRIEDYLRIYPHIPDGLPQPTQGLFMRLQTPITTPQGLLNQQLVKVPSAHEDEASFVLDNEFVFGASGLNDDQVWDQIQSFRNTKNLFFEDAITDKTKEMIA